MAITATRPTASRITATRPTATSINAGGGGEVCRNVSNFDGTSSYAQFDNQFTLTGEFSLSMYVDITKMSTQIVMGNSSNTVSSLIFRTTGFGQFGLRNNTSSDVRFDLLDATTAGLIEIVRDASNNVNFKFNGDDLGTQVLTGDILLDLIATYSSMQFNMEGAIKDISINIGNGAGVQIDLPMNEGTAGQTGTVNYINRTGNTDYNATGYNITFTEECEGDKSAYIDPEDWVDDKGWID